MTTPTSITTTVHLHPGTPREREVQVRALVVLSYGRYRIDKLEALDFGFVGAHELDEVYEAVIDAARSYGNVPESERRT